MVHLTKHLSDESLVTVLDPDVVTTEMLQPIYRQVWKIKICDGSPESRLELLKALWRKRHWMRFTLPNTEDYWTSPDWVSWIADTRMKANQITEQEGSASVVVRSLDRMQRTNSRVAPSQPVVKKAAADESTRNTIGIISIVLLAMVAIVLHNATQWSEENPYISRQDDSDDNSSSSSGITHRVEPLTVAPEQSSNDLIVMPPPVSLHGTPAKSRPETSRDANQRYGDRINSVPHAVLIKQCSIIKVTSGDEFDCVTRDGEMIRVRLADIDAPEKGQPFWSEAKQQVGNIANGFAVNVTIVGKNAEGHVRAYVECQGAWLNLNLVRSGHAWHYVEYAPNDQELRQAQRQAHRSHNGIWAGSQTPIAPWEWRNLATPLTETFKVIKIVDGDTVDVLTPKRETIRLRLNGIDAPETAQPYGKNAKEWLSKAIGGKMVQVQVTEKDRYGRSIAEIRYRGKSINLELVKVGLAWRYIQYAKDRRDLERAESDARQKRAGLWAGSHRIWPPWEWRKLSKVERDQYR